MARAWGLVILLLLACRLPSVVQPAGGDQGLYAYAGQRLLAGGVMYRDVWDQKPPGIAFLYAGLLSLWPHESVVPAADLIAAAGVAALLLVLGHSRFSPNVGGGAAALFLVAGDPYARRLGGLYVRGQCEPFIALGVVATLALLARAGRSTKHLVAAGALLAMVFWLKYNAAAYALPVLAAVWAWRAPSHDAVPATVRDSAWIALGFAAVTALMLGYFAAHGALDDLRLATIDYNLRYSNETYAGVGSMLRYLVTFPLTQARIEMLWFLGGLGLVLLVPTALTTGSTLVVVSWVLASVVSIAVNGSRSLPNYFVQADPALALAASAGLAAAIGYRPAVRYAVAALLVLGLWRVGSDTPVWGMRLASLPGVVQNIRGDLAFIRGHVDRDTYLERFRGQKYDALEIERLTRYISEHTAPADYVFVFGFSGGSVGWKSARTSPSRFFWSRPILIEFAAEVPGYGSTGLLADLRAHPPAVVALQKDEWQSQDFFLEQPLLRTWLNESYRLDRDTRMFSIWLHTP